MNDSMSHWLRGSLFVKTPSAEATPLPSADLAALLELPTVTRHAAQPSAAARIERPPARRYQPRRSTWWRRTLGSVWPPAVGMLVMLLGGGAVASTVGTATPNVGLPPVPPSPLRLGDAPAAGPPRPGVAPAADVALAEASAAASSRTSQTWVVQVGAFASRERAMLSIARLTAAGWPAYLDEPDVGARGNPTMVLVGPYGAAAVADVARDRLRTTPGYEGAFVRGVTPGK